MSEEELIALSDEEKIKLLRTVNSEQIKSAIIKTLQSDEKKLEELDKISDEFAWVFKNGHGTLVKLINDDKSQE